MYNRYIPAPDGSFQKQIYPDSPAPLPIQPSPQKQPVPLPKDTQPAQSIRGFLGGLLPDGLDTEDLIVVLLLLLMSENGGTKNNTSLITMLIYLFL